MWKRGKKQGGSNTPEAICSAGWPGLCVCYWQSLSKVLVDECGSHIQRGKISSSSPHTSPFLPTSFVSAVFSALGGFSTSVSWPDYSLLLGATLCTGGRMSGSICDLCSRDPRNRLPGMTTKSATDSTKCPLKGKNYPSPLENTGLHMTRKEGTNTLVYSNRGKWQRGFPPIHLGPNPLHYESQLYNSIKERLGKNDKSRLI